MNELIYRGRVIGKPRMTQSDKWKKRPCVVEYFNFKDDMTRIALHTGFSLSNRLMIQVEIEPPESYTPKRKNDIIGSLHDQKPDIDNIVKAIFDSLAKDDKAIGELHVRKIWSRENKITIQNL